MAAGRGGGTNKPPVCHGPSCSKQALVYLSGRALCAEHYLETLNELNDLGLTPRGLSEKPEPGESPAPERRIRAPVEGPARDGAPKDSR